ncbi:uncharacterized protein BJ171DRAFT_597244 [Polychytrium aggregatum]|uniref:uncharacterized protein n=1 Tax=Polychytrium aggregatum TaxID=110093 RepID=UPI0022FF0D0A|nr:uncharacterized protein BJ171DRAFT_597244 [Polychytrium aggregatum]KAI9206568.1 hypothetical protein BJ171DRAFT_597244 [Polychytrium aggregatum]
MDQPSSAPVTPETEKTTMDELENTIKIQQELIKTIRDNLLEYYQSLKDVKEHVLKQDTEYLKGWEARNAMFQPPKYRQQVCLPGKEAICVNESKNDDVNAESFRILGKLGVDASHIINHCNPTTDKERIALDRLRARFSPTRMQETRNAEFTSYTVNKGTLISMCIRDRQTGEVIPPNLLMYVMLHELAHVASASEGHNGEFLENFRFLKREAHRLATTCSVDISKIQVISDALTEMITGIQGYEDNWTARNTMFTSGARN